MGYRFSLLTLCFQECFHYKPNYGQKLRVRHNFLFGL